ncbi:MAG: bifunctional folylpolyglutamate synthase/dihydrofolate synthase [Deltaproteobacteria bacterium]|nr:bifunctional folylpolyglutamate synthase/dihydrofolate synthase [Deltaproteobacteria bacterium]MBN2672169.1 bifunctional folylpolyglutamate synthase/dihydrofolate synthase [Deltaproteobacteria bacterium]
MAADSTLLDQLYAISPKGISLGLERMNFACARFDHPQRSFSVIQVAGTNGKGSVSTMLERSLRATGLKTGLFTSPHIHRFTERFQINGEEISFAQMAPPLSRVLELTRGRDAISLTFFEVATLAAFLIFQEARVDVAVLEVGLGGRLDATSVAVPKVGVITSIALDHQDYLGNTIDAIAREKAAIAKPGMPLICGRLCAEALQAVSEIAAEREAPLRVIDDELPDDLQQQFSAPFFIQPHQRYNALLALTAYTRYCELSRAPGSRAVFFSSLQSFGVSARFEWIHKDHSYLLDGAHNLEAMQALVTSLASAQVRVGQIVFGALTGKPVDDMLALLQSVTPRILLVEAPVARTMNVKEVSKKWGFPRYTLDEALVPDASETGVTLVTGSFFVAAAARQRLLDELSNTPVAL